jgi:hypothetical protein
MKKKLITNPFLFSNELGFLTLASIGGFTTFKFMNKLYEELYEPIIVYMLPDNKCKQELNISDLNIRIGILMRDFVKWFVIILIIMLIYHYFYKRNDI